MKLRWKIALVVVGGLVVLLAINTITTGTQTKRAEVTVDGGQILSLSRGDVQVTDSGEPAANGQPIVLLHCYTCSLRWYEGLEPLLAERHRVVRIDLLGHGGSEKPESGYAVENQAALVAEAMNALEVQGALVVGHSLGAMVTASLAEQASQLVDRAVVIGMAPNTSDFGDGLPFTNRLSRAPVVGEALWRITPDFAIRDNVDVSFAPGYDFERSFADPDTPVEDVRAMSYTSYDEVPDEGDDFVEALPLDERFRQSPVPLLVVFGAEDQIFDASAGAEGFADVPGVQTEIVAGAGHAPQVEQPQEVASLIESFAVDIAPAGSGRAERRTRERDNPRDRNGKKGARQERKGADGRREQGARK